MDEEKKGQGEPAPIEKAPVYESLTSLGHRSLDAYVNSLESVGAYAWLHTTGQRLNFLGAESASGLTQQAIRGLENVRLPGIAVYEFVPTPGISTSNQSAINKGAQIVFDTMKARLSSNLRVSKSELGMYLMQVDSPLMLMKVCERALSYIMFHPTLNDYQATEFLTAMNLDKADWEKNKTLLINKYNDWCQYMTSLNIPSNIPYLARHLELLDCVYVTSEDITSPFYMFVPALVYKRELWNPETEPGNTALTVQYFGPSKVKTPWTAAKFIELMDSLLDAMKVDDNFSTLKSYFAAVYGADSTYVFTGITADAMLGVKYDPELQAEVENALILNVPKHGKGNDAIIQKYKANDMTWDLYYNPVIPDLQPGSRARCIVSLPFRGSNVDVAAACRFMPVVDTETPAPNNASYSITLKACGSEYLSGMWLWHFVTEYDVNGVPHTTLKTHDTTYRYNTSIDLSQTDLPGYLTKVWGYASDLMQFNTFPMIRMWIKRKDEGSTDYKYDYAGTFHRLRYWAFVDPEQLVEVHNIQMKAWWGVSDNPTKQALKDSKFDRNRKKDTK